MFVRASSTLILVVSLVTNSILATVCGQQEPFYRKWTELTVTNGICVTVD
jgi:hypothetical protein